MQAVQSSWGRFNRLSVKPPRPPVRHSRSGRSEDDNYDNMAPTFQFPVSQVRTPLTADDNRWILTTCPEAAEQSPYSKRWVPAQRQRSLGTSSSKELSRLRHGHLRRPTDEETPGDMSVCIGLTVQCSPLASTTVDPSAPSFITSSRRYVAPPVCGAAMVNPAEMAWRRSHPTSTVPAHSYDDAVRYRVRRKAVHQQLDFIRGRSEESAPTFRQSNPAAVAQQWPPQRGLGGDLPVRLSDWKGQNRGRPSFEDVAVGFENDSSVDAGEVLQLQAGFAGHEEETAFDEITQQIASLTQTVNDLRSKHRRPSAAQGDEYSRIARNTHGGAARTYR